MNRSGRIMLSLGMVCLILVGVGCESNVSMEGWVRHKPFGENATVTIAMPAEYQAKEIWSPDTDIVLFAHPENVADVYVEIGEMGRSDFDGEFDRTQMLVIDDYEGVLIKRREPKRYGKPNTMMLFFGEFNKARVWAHYDDAHEAEVGTILQSFRLAYPVN